MLSPGRQRINLLLRQAKENYALAAMFFAVTHMTRVDDPAALDRAFQLQNKAIKLTEEAFRLMEQEDVDMRRWVVDDEYADTSRAPRNSSARKIKDAD